MDRIVRKLVGDFCKLRHSINFSKENLAILLRKYLKFFSVNLSYGAFTDVLIKLHQDLLTLLTAGKSLKGSDSKTDNRKFFGNKLKLKLEPTDKELDIIKLHRIDD